jgi:hypothetical protein
MTGIVQECVGQVVKRNKGVRAGEISLLKLTDLSQDVVYGSEILMQRLGG